MPDSAYGFWARLLHRIALGAGFVAEASFDIDRAMTKPDGVAAAGGKHVFVSGLARAGTTILMRQLHATGAFRSLTYRDMPFVLAPNLWARLTGATRRGMERQERAHGDGILVDFDSPEALEEVFWRIFAGDAYIRPDRLVPMAVGAETRDRFRTYVAMILSRGGDRYLSKNNNNILRLPGIAAAFPEATILIPFREPLAQAASLLGQHRLFAESHRTDPFGRRYMDWLVHREFGSGHMPFVFDGARPVGDPESIDYWLDLWRAAYRHLADHAGETAVFVSYERLCAGAVWPRLCARLELPVAETAETLRLSGRRFDTGADAGLVAECDALHARLLALSERL